MRPIILYRESRETMNAEELSAAREHFECTNSRMKIQAGDLVVPRYSLYPFARELEADINFVGAKLVNTYQQHLYVADLKNWVYDLNDCTPPTWDRLENLPEDCAFVLKGATNSRKHDWNSLMWAADKKAAMEVHSKLCADGLIGSQDIYIRKYIPLKTYLIGIKDLPITEEYRFFIAFGEIISKAFYWSSHFEEIKELGFNPDPNEVPEDFVREVINRIGIKNNFYVIDIARTATGDWIVIELNCGEQSGLSENDPKILYCNLKKVIDKIYME